VEQPKVFEFAKELGVQPLELLDKLKQWKIPVKSHMSSLDEDTMTLIRSKFDESSTKSKTTKKTVRKKVAKKTATVAKAKTPAGAAEKSKSTPVLARKKKVIRRKVAPSEAEALAEAEAKVQAEAAAAEKAAIVEQLEANALSLNLADVDVVSAEPALAPSEQPSENVPAPAAAQIFHEKLAEVPSPETPGPRPSVKREVIVKPEDRQAALERRPRGNIVGRMDLSRATPPPRGPRPGGGFAPRTSGPDRGAAGGGYRGSAGGPPGTQGQFRPPPRMGTSVGAGAPGAARGNIRPGFFSAPGFESPDARHRDDKKRKTGGRPGTDDDAARGLEEEVPGFSATEFRKREVVFQPKKKTNMLSRDALKTKITTPKASKMVVKVHGSIEVSELAKQLKSKLPQLTVALMKNGLTVKPSDVLDFETATLVASEFGYETENTFRSSADLIQEKLEGEKAHEKLVYRPPIVTVMGHVDHGKTSLLDAIRKADVAAKEAGGITQHIGAYHVTLEDGSIVTFIDTPGHEAFTAMRARGANVTDIAVIVVAADDGMMPQTTEAVNHAKAAGVPIIVAVNKMDKPGANPERVKQQLTELELVPEEWGGSNIFCEVSAIQKTGIKELLESIKLTAEILELKADPDASGSGAVIESRMDKGRGVVATLLVQNGTLRTGQAVVAGASYGRIKAMMDDRGKRVDSAPPGFPVEVLGLSVAPTAGDRFVASENEETARSIAEAKTDELQKAAQINKQGISLEDLFSKVQSGDVKELPVVLKTDMTGSAEAVKAQLEKLSTAEVKVKVIHTAVGGIKESDVLLASTAKGIILGFNVRPDGSAVTASKKEGVEIKSYSIIYELLEDVEKAMKGLLAPEIIEKPLGRAEVRSTFSVPKAGVIAGCLVQDGKVVRNALARLVRDGRIIYEGKIGSLRRFKDDAREVASGFECGVGIENFNDIKAGDVIEVFEKQEIARELR